MRQDVATILIGMGYAVGVDFDAHDDKRSGVRVQWLAQAPQPTEAEIEAAAPAVLAAAARAAIKPVSSQQMLRALHRAGLLETIQAAVAASDDVELQIAFARSQEFQRNNPFLQTMAQALGKTDAEVDAIFALAATL